MSLFLPVLFSLWSKALKEKKAWAIASGGFETHSLSDAGLYGIGMYFTSNAYYTVPQIANLTEPTIIICFILPANAYPVIEFPNGKDSLGGARIKGGYQSHYVVTTLEGFPFIEKDYLENQSQYNEIVIDQESQMLPIFILEVDEKICGKLSRKSVNEKPQGIITDGESSKEDKDNRFLVLTDVLDASASLIIDDNK